MNWRAITEVSAMVVLAIGIGFEFSYAWAAIVLGSILVFVAVLGRLKGL